MVSVQRRWLTTSDPALFYQTILFPLHPLCIDWNCKVKHQTHNAVLFLLPWKHQKKKVIFGNSTLYYEHLTRCNSEFPVQLSDSAVVSHSSGLYYAISNMSLVAACCNRLVTSCQQLHQLTITLSFASVCPSAQSCCFELGSSAKQRAANQSRIIQKSITIRNIIAIIYLSLHLTLYLFFLPYHHVFIPPKLCSEYLPPCYITIHQIQTT